MNKQGKLIQTNGLTKVVGGIEWTKRRLADGNEHRGFTWNPVGGCFHGCRWTMPDGTVAECYAKTVAERLAQGAYSEGFEHHYWRPTILQEPLSVKEPANIFLDSMADLFGHWVPDEQVEQVLAVTRAANWHTFQALTKNAPRLLKFNLPANVWAGVSSPPDFMWGKPIARPVQQRMLHRILQVLSQLKGNVTWISFEPLSWDVAPLVAQYPSALRWAVIGAASNGPKKYQPDSDHVQGLLDVLDGQGVPVFFKGNIEWDPWREEFP